MSYTNQCLNLASCPCTSISNTLHRHCYSFMGIDRFLWFFSSTTLIHVYLQLSNILNFQVQMDYFSNTSGDSDEEDVICPSGIFNLSRCGGMKRSNHFPPEQIPKRRRISKNESSKCFGKTFPRVRRCRYF